MKYGNKNRKAFTLAEAMIAMVILAVATSAVILPFSAGAAMHTEGAKRTLAAKLAGDLLEEFQNMDSYFSILLRCYPELEGMVEDANGQFFSDPVYSKFARISTCSLANVGGEDMWWVTVEIRYDSLIVLQMSTLVGP